MDMTFDRSFIGPGSLSALVPALWKHQIADWPRLRDAVTSLRNAQTKTFRVGGSTVVAQYNPAREVNSSAKVDAASLAARPCFLCVNNLPREQCAIIYRKDYLILCNPAPIFEPHFTVNSMSHQPQNIETAAPIMLDLARDLNGSYTLFYNGPKCGASAPDHMHLQACPVALMPHEKELVRNICCGRSADTPGWIDWVRSDPVRIGVSRPEHRPAVFLIGRSHADLLYAIQLVLGLLGEIHPATPEPMLNLFVTYADECWTVWLYPRRAHRPSIFGTGPDDFLLSPGSVDVAGLLIVPRAADFHRLNEQIIARVYDEVLFTPGQMAGLREGLIQMEPIAKRAAS
jgi:hypothetical protein